MKNRNLASILAMIIGFTITYILVRYYNIIVVNQKLYNLQTGYYEYTGDWTSNLVGLLGIISTVMYAIAAGMNQVFYPYTFKRPIGNYRKNSKNAN